MIVPANQRPTFGVPKDEVPTVDIDDEMSFYDSLMRPRVIEIESESDNEDDSAPVISLHSSSSSSSSSSSD